MAAIVWMGLFSCEALEMGRLPDQARQYREGPLVATVPDCRLAIQCPELLLDVERCIEDEGLFEVTMLEGEPVALRLSRTASLSTFEAGSYFAVAGTDCNDALALQFEVLARTEQAPEPTETGVTP